MGLRASPELGVGQEALGAVGKVAEDGHGKREEGSTSQSPPAPYVPIGLERDGRRQCFSTVVPPRTHAASPSARCISRAGARLQPPAGGFPPQILADLQLRTEPDTRKQWGGGENQPSTQISMARGSSHAQLGSSIWPGPSPPASPACESPSAGRSHPAFPHPLRMEERH